MKHSISAIIPCYNAELFLAEAIESVLKQTRPVKEIIVVDDGSIDRSAEIAQSYGVRVFSMGQNRGHAVARNAGADIASGEVLAWLDADDYWYANHCELVCSLLERHPVAVFGFAANRLIGTRSGIHYRSPYDHEPFDAFWASFRYLYPVNYVVRRSAYLAVEGFDDRIRFAPDFDFTIRLSRRFRFISTPEVTSVYRWHPAQISSSSWKRQLRSVYETRARFLQAIRHGGEEELARLVEKELLDIFDEDVRRACRWNSEEVRELVALRALVPGSRTIGRRVWLRTHFPEIHFLRRWGSRARVALRLRTRIKDFRRRLKAKRTASTL
jgi:glycosyltransferase involved in cell wall biosynthesis